MLGGAVLLQNANDHSKKTDSVEAIAADRSADATANRGSARSDASVLASENQAAADAVTSTEAPTTAAPTTTAAPVTTTPPTTAAPKPAPAPAPKPAAAPAPAPKPAPALNRQTTTPTTAAPKPAPAPAVGSGDAVWTRLAQCESGMRNDLGAPYYGYFQFSAQTWKAIGGTGLPSDHTWDEQLAMAKKLQARSGWGQWPVCSKKALG